MRTVGMPRGPSSRHELMRNTGLVLPMAVPPSLLDRPFGQGPICGALEGEIVGAG
jgi:hypothetical protein